MINADYFRVVSRFVADAPDPVHKSLQGVMLEPNIERGGVIMTATDGLTMCSIWDPIGYVPMPRVICVPNAKSWNKYKAKGAFVHFQPPNLVVKDMMAQTIHSEPFTDLDAFNYPKWRRVMHAVEEGCGLVPRTSFYLSDLEKFNFTGTKEPVAIWTDPEDQMPTCYWVTHHNYPTMIGAVMAVTTDQDHMFRRPVWLQTN